MATVNSDLKNIKREELFTKVINISYLTNSYGWISVPVLLPELLLLFFICEKDSD